MSHIIGSPCVSTCDTACVAVCPVDCIHGPIDIEGAGAEVANMSKEELKDKMLYINPDECIDCGVCQPECPIDAIVPDYELDKENLIKWTEINQKYSEVWPVITESKDALPDHEEWDGVPDKLTMLSGQPGNGDL